MKYYRLIRKYLEYISTKISVKFNEKEFYYDKVRVKYLFQKKKEQNLVVVFSACTREGVPARYNYVKTLRRVRAAKLFILDDFGPTGRGSFYLGTMPDFRDEKAVTELIKNIIDLGNYKKVIFCGSCKGGYAALNIGSRFRNSVIVAGEPTYRIASRFALAKELISYWMGEPGPEKIRYFDYYLTEKLQNNGNKNTQKVYYFYSTKDEYAEQQSGPLLNDMLRFGYNVNCEEAFFEKHGDLGLYFADYLKKILAEILQHE